MASAGAASAGVLGARGGGRSVAYCVRLCDGRYFPIQRHANASPAQLCSAFCPAAKTQVFGIESPGLTSALSIAAEVVGQVR